MNSHASLVGVGIRPKDPGVIVLSQQGNQSGAGELQPGFGGLDEFVAFFDREETDFGEQLHGLNLAFDR